MNLKMIEMLKDKIESNSWFFLKLKSGLFYTAKIVDIQEKENQLLILDKFQRLSLLDISSIEQMTEQEYKNDTDSMRDFGVNYK